MIEYSMKNKKNVVIFMDTWEKTDILLGSILNDKIKKLIRHLK